MGVEGLACGGDAPVAVDRAQAFLEFFGPLLGSVHDRQDIHMGISDPVGDDVGDIWEHKFMGGLDAADPAHAGLFGQQVHGCDDPGNNAGGGLGAILLDMRCAVIKPQEGTAGPADGQVCHA